MVVKSSPSTCHSKRKDFVKLDTNVTSAMLEFNTRMMTFGRVGEDEDVVNFHQLFCLAEEDGKPMLSRPTQLTTVNTAEPEVPPDFKAVSTSIVANFLPPAWPQDVRMPASSNQEIEPCELNQKVTKQRFARRGQFEITITEGNKESRLDDMLFNLVCDVRAAYWFELPMPWKQEATWTRECTPDGRGAGKYWGQTLKLSSRYLFHLARSKKPSIRQACIWSARRCKF